MRRVVGFLIVFIFFLFASYASFAFGQSAASGERKILVDSVVVSGTQAIDAAELADIIGSLPGSKYDDDPEEIQERLRSAFQDRGYIQAEISKFEMKPIDPLASPKPVRIEAELHEGPLCTFSSVEFTRSHFMSTEELRAMFPLKVGDVFAKAKIAGGLRSMMESTRAHGLLDAFAVPQITVTGTAVSLVVDIHEGPQYRMGELEILGLAEVEEKMRLHWTLEPGAVFDRGYITKFIAENSSLLPANFVEGDGVKIFRDCKASTASVHIHLVQDSQHDMLDRTLTRRCDNPDGKEQ